jgi:hypothetical protein
VEGKDAVVAAVDVKQLPVRVGSKSTRINDTRVVAESALRDPIHRECQKPAVSIGVRTAGARHHYLHVDIPCINLPSRMLRSRGKHFCVDRAIRCQFRSAIRRLHHARPCVLATVMHPE